MTGRKRARDLGLVVGELPTGPSNAITDVPDVAVGHTTLIEGEGPLRPGYGPVRTGVTVILPYGGNLFREKVRAAVHTINGFGKALGFEEVRELGVIEGPIALTNTLNVGLVADALVQYMVRHNPDIGIRTHSLNVVVGETNDGYLNDLQGRHVRAEHVWAALESARTGGVAEGNVGAGTGTTCFGWKGGIGTSSRVTPRESGGWTVGALVQANFGEPGHLFILGRPVGRPRPDGLLASPPGDNGSIMIVLATDAPLSERQLGRLCKRAAAGLARLGSVYGHGSGDFVIAFSTAFRIPDPPPALTASSAAVIDEASAMRGLFPAVADCVEESVLNALCMAQTMAGRDGHVRYALPIAEFLARL
ncbi:MAG: P1 family peptidase [Nitrososphaerales archaeon]